MRSKHCKDFQEGCYHLNHPGVSLDKMSMLGIDKLFEVFLTILDLSPPGCSVAMMCICMVYLRSNEKPQG
jgi:hypothetical protein